MFSLLQSARLRDLTVQRQNFKFFEPAQEVLETATRSPRKVTWNLKIQVGIWKMTFLLKGVDFQVLCWFSGSTLIDFCPGIFTPPAGGNCSEVVSAHYNEKCYLETNNRPHLQSYSWHRVCKIIKSAPRVSNKKTQALKSAKRPFSGSPQLITEPSSRRAAKALAPGYIRFTFFS